MENKKLYEDIRNVTSKEQYEYDYDPELVEAIFNKVKDILDEKVAFGKAGGWLDKFDKSLNDKIQKRIKELEMDTKMDPKVKADKIEKITKRALSAQDRAFKRRGQKDPFGRDFDYRNQYVGKHGRTGERILKWKEPGEKWGKEAGKEIKRREKAERKAERKLAKATRK